MFVISTFCEIFIQILIFVLKLHSKDIQYITPDSNIKEKFRIVVKVVKLLQILSIIIIFELEFLHPKYSLKAARVKKTFRA